MTKNLIIFASGAGSNAQAIIEKATTQITSKPGYSYDPRKLAERIAAGIEVGHIYRGARYDGGTTWSKLNDKGDVVNSMTLTDAQHAALANMALTAAAVGAASKGYGHH